jgi:hypothetical protein
MHLLHEITLPTSRLQPPATSLPLLVSRQFVYKGLERHAVRLACCAFHAVPVAVGNLQEPVRQPCRSNSTIYWSRSAKPRPAKLPC